ncbi:hypothetical protein LIER_07629 [Lithospermum erythrorhizon]|uniref:Uncharacterized protein n=1 Tax=Lithospermum erythrorhizon TaxID=34254 RepID=A0AAV3PAM5_LITER
MKNVKESEEIKQKGRHIVSWSPEEDDILREQIHLHGTDNWTIIASKFTDKTTRQCRRRWYTYLNSDFKKGGWSPEEDMLLCEAQKLYGNRWTEIAKVVSGRTDNAVKNRFSTLCKKRAKHETLEKENNGSVNLNNKRVIFPDGLNLDGSSESAATLKKKTRAVISSISEAHGLRPPFAALDQNLQTGANNLLVQQQSRNKIGAILKDDNKIQGTFLKKNDSRIHALMQQEELLSSLALKVNMEDTDQSLDNAWQVLQNYLNQNKDCDPSKMINGHSSREIANFMDFVEDFRNSNEGYQPLSRQSELHMNSPSSSGYSTGSTMLNQLDSERTETGQAYQCVVANRDIEVEKTMGMICPPSSDKEGNFLAHESIQTDEIVKGVQVNMEFSSPTRLTPLFRTLAAEVPTPNFSESEKHFLIKTFGLESPSRNQSANVTKSPTCKRVLLDSL